MSKPDDLRPASDEEVASTLAYALRFDGRGRPWPAGMEIAAGVAGRVLADGLKAQGVEVKKVRGLRPKT